jgi:hypothetical protein
MESLSNLFKKSDAFRQEFDRIFPAQPFNKVNILHYISACTAMVINEARKSYPDHHLKFINPVFVVDNEIFAAGSLPGDPTLAKLTRPYFDLVQDNTIMAISQPVRDNLLAGACFFYGNEDEEQDYKLFINFDLSEIAADVTIRANEIHDIYVVEGLKDLNIGVAQIISKPFLDLCARLGVVDDGDKIKLIKSLVLFKSMARYINSPLVFSFINKFNQSHSFFDCLLTFVSEKQFDEDTLLDFAHITETICLPLENYDYSKSKGISKSTMAKRNSLKTLLVRSFKRV